MATSEGEVTLDSVLWSLGAFGRYQTRALALLALVYATNSVYNINYVFAIQDVGYRCVIPECENSSSPASLQNEWTGFSMPTLVADDDGSVKTCLRFPHVGNGDGGCSPGLFDNTTLQPCTQYVYEDPNSFVAEFDLGCEEWKRTLIGTAHSFGIMIGLLFQGLISDRFGRKKAAVFAGSAGALLGLAKSFVTSYWTYVALECLEAAIGDALSPIFMLSIEIVPKKRLVMYQSILLNCYTGGLLLMPLVSWAVPYWRHFLRVIYAPTLAILFYSLLLDESVRWLFSKGRRQDAIALLKKAAAVNDIKLDNQTLEKLDYKDESECRSGSKRQLFETLRSPVLLRRLAVCAVWWVSITLINYGMMITSVLIDGDKYWNFALLMLMDIPANLLYWAVLVNYDRKVPLLMSFMVGGVFCVTQPFVPLSMRWLRAGLFLTFEMLATLSYNIVYTYTSELFPTHSRNAVHAMCAALGRLGGLLAPQTPLLMSVWRGLPCALFGASSLACGALVLLVPETARHPLPDTVRQAERIGRPPSDSDPLDKTPLRTV